MNKTQTRNLKVATTCVLLLCLIALILFFTQLKGNKPLSVQEKTFKRADHYAKTLIDTKFLQKAESQAPLPRRALASTGYQREVLEGKIGLDPWGDTLNYLVKKDHKSPNKGTLILWSSGPNGKLETSRDSVAEDHTTFQGDDFGKTYTF